MKGISGGGEENTEDLLVAEIKVCVGLAFGFTVTCVLKPGLKERMCLSYEKKSAGWRLACALFFVQEVWSLWFVFVGFFYLLCCMYLISVDFFFLFYYFCPLLLCPLSIMMNVN